MSCYLSDGCGSGGSAQVSAPVGHSLVFWSVYVPSDNPSRRCCCQHFTV